MLLFAVNFNLYYYILRRRIGDVTHNEELRWFLGIFFAAVLTMTVANIGQFGSFGESLHHTAFNAASVYSTTASPVLISTNGRQFQNALCCC